MNRKQNKTKQTCLAEGIRSCLGSDLGLFVDLGKKGEQERTGQGTRNRGMHT